MRFLIRLVLTLCVVVASPLAWSAEAINVNHAFMEGMTAYNAKEYDRAIEQFTAVIRASPNGDLQQVLYNLGFAYYFRLRFQEAVDTFETFLKKYPKTPNLAEVHLCAARALLLASESKADQALQHLTEALKDPNFEQEARFLAAEAYIKKGDTSKAASTLQAALRGSASGPTLLRGTLKLVDVYIKSNEDAKALELLHGLETSPGYPDVIVAVNHRFLQIGDRALEAQSYPGALAAYTSVRPRNQVIAIQTARLEEMRKLKTDYEARIMDAAKAATTDRSKPASHDLEDKLATLEGMIELTEKTLGELKTLNEYDAAIQYRISRCYYNMERYWPAGAGFEIIAAENPESADASTALYGAILCQWNLKRAAAACKLCDLYLKKYSNEAHAAQAAELNATLLLQLGRNKEAIEFLDKYLQEHSQTDSKETFLTLLANGRFQAGDFDKAAAAYDTLCKEFPKSTIFEEFTYRRALCDFLRSDYKATMKAFDAYEAKYPKGQFSADIRYRRGIILLAFQEYDKLIALMEELLKDPAVQGYGGQVHTLLGDAWSAKKDNQKAADEYAAAVRAANGDDNVIRYSLEQATGLYRANRRTEELVSLWRDFIALNPKHPMVLRGVGELSKVLARSNQREEARKMLAEYAMKEIHNVRSEYVEPLLSQLAGLFAPARTFKKDAPTPDPNEIEAELAKFLEVPEDQRTATYLVRIEFAKSELARIMRDPTRNTIHLNAIAGFAKPEDLSPILLSTIGHFLLGEKQYDKAAPFFARLRESFADSAFSDAAPVGLGEIALAKEDYEKAVEEFDFALNKATGTGMAKEATFGKALALFRLKKYPEAKTLFEQVVNTKDWRGMEKAGALYYLGEIAAETGDKGAANAYFQRVYISHGAYVDFVRKSILRSADMLEADGQHDAAVTTLRELLRNPKHAGSEEAKIAKQRIPE